MAVDFACPRCRGAIAPVGDEYHCAACATTYPIVLGIPDFRVAPDPWIGIEADRAKGVRVAALTAASPHDLASAVRAYWAITPETPNARVEHFVTHVLGAETRAEEWLDVLGATHGAGDAWLDVGCGTGDLIAVAARRGVRAVGVDVAFRWLAVGGRRNGALPRLVCGNGERLPFADASFARVFCAGTLEHCRDAGQLLAETARVLRPGGTLHVRTVNRFAPTREPHVGVWGVGYVPRALADRYVRWRSGQRYLHHRPLSARELAIGLRVAGFERVRIAGAALLPTDRGRMGAAASRLAVAYERLRRTSGLGPLVAWVAPLLEASAVAPAAGYRTASVPAEFPTSGDHS